MKRVCALLLSLCLFISLMPALAVGPNGTAAVQVYDPAAGAYAQAVEVDVVRVSLNGETVETDMPAVNWQGRTMIPVRAIAEALEAEVEWVQERNQVVLRKKSDTIVLTLNSATALVNGVAHELYDGIPAMGMRTGDGNERTMVPLRFVSEELEALVDWDQATYTAMVTTGDRVEETPSPEETPAPEETPIPEEVPPLVGEPEGETSADYAVASVKVDSTARTVRINTRGTGGWMVTDLGDRVVVDLPGAALPGDSDIGSVGADNDYFVGVRWATHGDGFYDGYDYGVRVVVDLTEETSFGAHFEVVETASGLMLRAFEQKEYTPTAPVDPGNYLIALDAGHGGTAYGAVYGGVVEKKVALAMTQKLEAILLGMGYQVIMTRDEDVFVSLDERCDIANEAKADIFVSIHLNAAENNDTYEGFSVYHYPGSKRGPVLAQEIQDAVVWATGVADRDVRSENFAVVRKTDMPAVLIETGFMSCPEELARLADEGYQDVMVAAIAEGIVRYLNGGN